MDYGYYEQDRGDEVVVHLDYNDPEPSLFQQSRVHDRPMLPKEYTPSVRTSNKRYSRRQHIESDMYSRMDENDDRRDDDMYGRMTEEYNIQEDLNGGNSSRRSVNSSGSSGYRHQVNLENRQAGSERTVVSRLSTSSDRPKNNKSASKMDLTRPDADSSFELFGTLLVQHLEPKVEGGQYTLEKGDIAYFDAIIPESLRLPFVEAVRIRNQRLLKDPAEGESALDQITRQCAALGLGQKRENNFLLQGGEKVDDKTIVRITGSVSDEEMQEIEYENVQFSRGSNDERQSQKILTEEDAMKKVEEAYHGREISIHDFSKESVQIDAATIDSKSIHSSKNDDNEVLDESKCLKKEDMVDDVIQEDASFHEPVFDLSAKEKADKMAQEVSKRKSNKSMRNFTSAISVNTSPSNLDTTVAAFEHEWRDGITNIFAHGVCHPMLFLSFVAPIFALGQVMTRLNLNWVGAPSNEAETKRIFRNLGTLVTWWASTNVGAVVAWIYFRDFVLLFDEAVVFFIIMVNMLFYGFCAFATGNTRAYLRDIYNIRDSSGSDYLLSAMYMPFVIAQMGRHTADYNSLQGRLCSTSGLAAGTDYSFITNMHSFGTNYMSFNDGDGASFAISRKSRGTRKSTRSTKSKKNMRSVHSSGKSRRSSRPQRSVVSREASASEDDESTIYSDGGTSYTGSEYSESTSSMV